MSLTSQRPVTQPARSRIKMSKLAGPLHSHQNMFQQFEDLIQTQRENRETNWLLESKELKEAVSLHSARNTTRTLAHYQSTQAQSQRQTETQANTPRDTQFGGALSKRGAKFRFSLAEVSEKP